MNEKNRMMRLQHHFPGCQIDAAFIELLRISTEERFPGMTCVSNLFFPDSKVLEADKRSVYPFQAPFVLGTQIPWEVAHFEPYYSRACAKAAYAYLCRVMNKVNPFSEEDRIDGFVIERQGWQYVIPEYITNPMLIVPDTFETDEYWEDGNIPIYILQQVRLYMALIREHNVSGKYNPSGLYVIRVKGNLTSEMDIRWIPSDPRREDALLRTADRVIAQRIAAGQAPVPEMKVLPKRDWKEIKQKKIEGFFVIEDDAAHDNLREYMALRSLRKELEKQSKDMKRQEDALALKIASQMPNAQNGTVNDPLRKRTYSIRHTPSVKRPLTLKPEHILAFAPEYAFAITEGFRKGRVEVDVL